jgi:hypothetical protein
MKSKVPSIASAKLEAEFGIQNQGDSGTLGGSGSASGAGVG